MWTIAGFTPNGIFETSITLSESKLHHDVETSDRVRISDQRSDSNTFILQNTAELSQRQLLHRHENGHNGMVQRCLEGLFGQQRRYRQTRYPQIDSMFAEQEDSGEVSLRKVFSASFVDRLTFVDAIVLQIRNVNK